MTIFLAVGFGPPLRAEQAKGVEGDWKGTLKAGGAELHLVLHIAKNSDGTLKATLDSIDQGANGIPINSISFQDSKLSFTSDAIHGSYEGKANSDLSSLSGTWTQAGNSLPLDFERAAAGANAEHKAAKPSDIDGAWMGVLDTGGVKLHIVFHITNTEEGLTATLDSPDQGAKAIPVSAVTRDGASLKMEVKAVGGGFEGKIGPDLSSIAGTWSQGGGALPLTLTKVKDVSQLEHKRPQNPVKPYPYRDEDVTYQNPAANITLAATLTLPQGAGPFPGVVLITGSGPQDRDETVFGHKPFLVLSDYLTRHGIAVLRADDRGTAKSTGDFKTATTADFSTDTEAGIAYLLTRPEINPRKIGLIGHSEGGIIAPMVAARNPHVAFIVMMAGSGVPGDQILVEQSRLIAEAMGTPHNQALKDAEDERQLLTLVEHEQDSAVLDKKARELLNGKIPEAQVGVEMNRLTSPWMRYFLTYDPAQALRRVTCPVLALNGSKDLQVPPAQNLPAIRKALEEGGNKHFEAIELPGLNHLFQDCKTGSPSEYAEIEETISPMALDKIASWINQQ